MILYINKDYLENIKKNIFEEFSSNDNIFWICKNFDNDRDSKKCNYYFDKSNFVKNDLSNDLSEVKGKKENIDKTYEPFNKKYKKIKEIFNDFDGDYLFYDLYDKYCNEDNSDDSDDLYESEYKGIIEEAKGKTEIDTSDIKDLLNDIKIYSQMINEKRIEGIKKNYDELCTIYNNIINLLPFQFVKFKKLKDEFLEKYEELNKNLKEINNKINEFNNLFKDSKDDIETFVEENIKEIYKKIPKENKNKKFINFFNEKYGTNYSSGTNKKHKDESDED